MATLTQEEMGWFAGMVDGARKAFGLAAAGSVSARAAAVETAVIDEPVAVEKKKPARVAKPARAKKRKRTATSRIDYRARANLSRRLAEEGFSSAQIARRTGLSQDTVSLLLKLAPQDSPEESAGTGSFFRTVQARLTGGKR